MNDVPPSNDGPDEVDQQYRRAAQLDRNRPSDAVRRAILEHATQRAAEHAAARGGQAAANDPIALRKKSARYRSRWPLAVFGTLAVAGIAGLLVAPQLPWRLVAPSAGVSPIARAPVNAATDRATAAPTTAAPTRPLGAPPPAAAPPAAAPPQEAARSQDAANQVHVGRSVSGASPAAQLESFARPQSPAARAFAAPQRLDSSGLRHASETGDVARLRSILDQPADIDAVDALGRTALMLATQNGREAAVETLLAHGADPNIPDARGRTPLDVARATGQTAIAAALQRAGAKN